MATACRLPGVGLHVASALRFLCGRYRGENRWGLAAIARGLQVSHDSARRGLHAAEVAGLLAVAREPGCKLSVSILELPELGDVPAHRPLYGPVPWAWWLTALRLPGQALQVATVCWLMAGWSRSAEFAFGLSDWAELGLTRFSAGRGLRTLERAGLVSVVDRPGRKPVVTVQEAPQGPLVAPDVESYQHSRPIALVPPWAVWRRVVSPSPGGCPMPQQIATLETIPSPAQLAAVGALVAGSTVTDAAATAGVDRATIYRWLRHDPDFLAEYNRLRREQADRLQAEIRGLASEAVAAVRELVTGPGVPPAVRLRAALAVLASIGGIRAEAIGPIEPEGARREMANRDLIDSLGVF